MTISEKIFDVMSEKNISQKEFAERTGISQSTISDWKRKGTNPAADKIMVICDALDISVYDLLNEGQGERFRQLDYMIIHKDSEEYILLKKFQNMSRNSKERLHGYLEALNSK